MMTSKGLSTLKLRRRSGSTELNSSDTSKMSEVSEQVSELSEIDNYHRTRTRPGQIRRTEHLRKSPSGHLCDSSDRHKSVFMCIQSQIDCWPTQPIGPRMEHMRTPCQTWNRNH